MNFGKQFKEGLITNNPVLVQLLGMARMFGKKDLPSKKEDQKT